MSREVRVAILGDSRDFGRAVDAAERDSRRLDGAFGRVGSGIGSMASTAALGVGALAVAGGAAAISFIQAAEESQAVTRQTDAVIRSMGASSWATADAVAELSSRLSNQTGIDDELIQSGQNVLLTFGEVQNRIGEGNNIFDRATAAALDMSVALGTDMAGASMQVGRALNDPIRGLAALRRSGIQFTDQQVEQITAMQEAGDMAGAQTVMLAELERQFGGSAAAQSTATQRMATMWGNLQEELGAKLLPTFERVTAWLGEHLPGIIDTVVGALGRLRDWFGRVVEVGRDLGEWMMDHKPILIGLGVAIGVGLVAAFTAWAISAASAAAATLAAAAPVIAIGVAIAALVAGVIYAYQNWDWFRNTVDTVARFLTDTVWPAIQAGARWIMDVLVPAIGAVIGKFIEWGGKAVEIGATIFRFIGDIVAWVTAMPGRISSAASGMWDGIKDTFRAAVNWLIDRWNNLRFPSATFGLPGFLGGGSVTIGGWELPDIPRLHSGGIFRTPNNEMEGLAVLQNGERVSARGSVDSGGGGPTQIIVQLDGRVLVDALVGQNRVNGSLPIVVQAVA